MSSTKDGTGYRDPSKEGSGLGTEEILLCTQSLTPLWFLLPMNSSLYSPEVLVLQTKQAAINPKPYPTSVWGTLPGSPQLDPALVY